jgi:hypothetical protein
MSIPANRLRAMVPISQFAIGPLALSARNAAVVRSISLLRPDAQAASGLISPASIATTSAGQRSAEPLADRSTEL